MDGQVEAFYKQILTDLVIDHDEAQDLAKYFDSLNPPPDKLVWLRSTAFRLGCDFLSEDQENNVLLLRAINAIVHSLENTCMLPRDANGNAEYDEEKVESFYRDIFSDLTVDKEENEALNAFFRENTPPAGNLVSLRAAAFKAAVDFLSDDNEKNISLLRCINVVVHVFERTCLLPKDYELKLKPEFDLNVSLSDAIQQMWDLDVNKLTPDVDYTLNVQEGKKPFWKESKASEPLFIHVDRDALNRPTYRHFIALLDNYNAHTGVGETITAHEHKEIMEFLKAIMQTAPMQYCHKYLLARGADGVPRDQSGFIKLLYKIWFELYHRERGDGPDSSGFEHVFVGEIKDDAISGLHSWIQFYIEEKKGNADYRGYIKPRSCHGAVVNSDDHLLTLQFSWHGIEKFVGTFFVGVSPEFEFAVYTTCFLLGEEKNDIILNTCTDEFHLIIRCYRMARDKIGTAFPEATAHFD